ncbi:MAG: alpha/beta fold hydrolase [Acidimicrobiia bacterium]
MIWNTSLCGRPGEEPVLLLHSLGTDHALWIGQLSAFTASHEVILVDSAGHGRSPWPASGAITAADWVADLEAVLSANGARRAHLVGVSMGGVQAIHFALTHPEMVASLVLADTFAGMDAAVAETRLTNTSGRARETGMEKFAEEYIASTLRPAVAPAVADRLRMAIAGVEEDAYLGTARAVFTSDARERIGSIAAPCLVLVGDLDDRTPLATAEVLAKGLADATLEVVPDAGHLSNVDNSAAFNESVLRFLAGRG